MAQQQSLRDFLPSDSEPSERYRVEVLVETEVGPQGISHRVGPDRRLLPWGQVECALVAEVGEPEGVRTVVFDLVIERKPDECLVCRFDADPTEDARGVAVSIRRHLAPEFIAPSLHELADEGISTRRYPDLETLAEATLAQLGLATNLLFSS